MTTNLSHTQARDYIERRANALGHEPWLAVLDSHLAHCAECRAFARRHAWLEHWLRQARPRRTTPRLAFDLVQRVYDRWTWHMAWLQVRRAAQRFAPALSLVFTLMLAGWWLAELPGGTALTNPRPSAYAHRLIPNVPEFELHEDGPVMVAHASEGEVARANYR